MGTLLGFDYGTKKIGIAVGQTFTATATALTTLKAKQQRPDWDKISELINTWQPEALVVGMPYDLDDSEAEVASRAQRFARQLEGRFQLPVHMADERLTSMVALQELKGGRIGYGDIDAIAAKLILETWLSEQ
ncbi:Putative pre-16S rRNA nuclease Yqg [hydrothermal vent metagenome]|uniref:Pre-16S rRNA nuclease Yqg n=1 Tax=hydrothermal vent metagenome TaxID=652676 RepID=A0A3B1AXL4_9ZZZZ